MASDSSVSCLGDGLCQSVSRSGTGWLTCSLVRYERVKVKVNVVFRNFAAKEEHLFDKRIARRCDVTHDPP